jgi:hypothetical protein
MGDSRGPLDKSENHAPARVPPQNPVIIKGVGVGSHRKYTLHATNQNTRYPSGQVIDMCIRKGEPVFSYGRCTNIQSATHIHVTERENLPEIFSSLNDMPYSVPIVFEGIAETDFRSDIPNRPRETSYQKSGFRYVENNGPHPWRPGDQIVARKPRFGVDFKSDQRAVPILEVAKPTSHLVQEKLKHLSDFKNLSSGDVGPLANFADSARFTKHMLASTAPADAKAWTTAFTKDSTTLVNLMDCGELIATDLHGKSTTITPASDNIDNTYERLVSMAEHALTNIGSAGGDRSFRLQVLFHLIIATAQVYDRLAEDQNNRSVGMSYGFAPPRCGAGAGIELHRLRLR